MPFVDVVVIDAVENPRGCPDSHPDELLFEVWHGISGMCDCLERAEDRSYYIGVYC